MRVRITRKPPPGYSADLEWLRVGRVYNLDASLASALLLDGCAETVEQLSNREGASGWKDAWVGSDYPRGRRPVFHVLRRSARPRRK